jgi:hypothetical protein
MSDRFEFKSLLPRSAVFSAILLTLWSSIGIAGMGHTSAAAAKNSDALASFNGVWKGTSVSNVNASSAIITLDIKRNGNELKGTYLCTAGNAVCRNNIQKGWMHGQSGARGFDVTMEDNSRCTYYMDKIQSSVAEGEYTCYGDGQIVDQGTFKLARSGPSHGPMGTHGSNAWFAVVLMH